MSVARLPETLQPSTEDLPFVLVYGPWIWKLALIALVAAVVLLVIAVRRIGARYELRTLLRLFDSGRAADGVIRGKLGGRGDGPLIATFTAMRRYEDDERAHWRAGELWVETDEGRVMLDGKIAVDLGTGGTARRRKLPEMPPGLLVGARELPRVQENSFYIAKTSTLSVGDEVIVRGKLERAPGDEGTGFREAANTWTLHAGEGERLRIAAKRPRVVLARMSMVAMLVVGGLTAFIGHRIALSVGEDWRGDCWDRDRYKKVDGFVELDPGDRCIRSAALPGQYERTLDAVYYSLSQHTHLDERSLARLLALAEQTEGCDAVLSLLEKHNRYEDLIVHAQRCGQPRYVRDALAATGRLDEASRVIVPGENTAPEPALLIATGRWSEAAEAADARARDYEASPDSDGSIAAVVLYYRCVGELFRHHAGDAGAFARLEKLESSSNGQICLPVLVEASPPAARPALIARFTEGRTHSFDTKHALEALAYLEGSTYPYEYDSAERTLARLDDPIGSGGVRQAWLTRIANLAPLTPEQRASALRWVAVGHILDGNAGEAQRAADEAVSINRGLKKEEDLKYRYILGDVELMPALVALHTSTIVDVDLATTGLEDADEEERAHRREMRNFRFGRLPMRAGRSIDETYFGPISTYVVALREAQDGDPRALIRHLGTGRWWHDGDILAVLPRIKTNREALVATLKLAPTSSSWTYLHRAPFELASAAAVRRDMFRLAGDATEAAYWDAVYRRVAATFDRKRLMAQVLWAN